MTIKLMDLRNPDYRIVPWLFLSIQVGVDVALVW